jgi:hypothetical protein
VSAVIASQLPGHEGTKFNRFSTTSGVTNSGASWDGTFYRTASGAMVRLTIVHLDSPEGVKNEYVNWLKQKAVRIISKEKVQDKSGSTEERAVAKLFVPGECDEGTAIFATAGKVLRIIQSCSVKAAVEFEKQVKHGDLNL